jgi:hypothetical protein
MPAWNGVIAGLIHKNTGVIHKVIHKKPVDFMKNSQVLYGKLGGFYR